MVKYYKLLNLFYMNDTNTQEKTTPVVDKVEEAKKILEAELQNKIEECKKEVEAVLEKYGFQLQVLSQISIAPAKK